VVVQRRGLVANTTGKLWCDRSLSWQLSASFTRPLTVTVPPWLPSCAGAALADSTTGVASVTGWRRAPVRFVAALAAGASAKQTPLIAKQAPATLQLKTLFRLVLTAAFTMLLSAVAYAALSQEAPGPGIPTSSAKAAQTDVCDWDQRRRYRRKVA
jgi:hypothetical protein